MISTTGDFHLFDGGEVGPHLLLADGSQVFGVDAAFAEALRAAEPDAARAMLGEVGLGERNFIGALRLKIRRCAPSRCRSRSAAIWAAPIATRRAAISGRRPATWSGRSQTLPFVD